MSETFRLVRDLVARGDVRISEHGYDQLAEDGLFARDIIAGIHDAQLVEDYPEYGKGPCVLVLQRGQEDEPVHVVWGIPQGASTPAVLVTAYRPDPDRWKADFLERQK
jgi:hypothetical protein